MPVSAGHPRLYNRSSQGCCSFVCGLSLVQDGDMVLTSQGVVVFSEAFLTGERKLSLDDAGNFSTRDKKKHESDNEHPKAEGNLAQGFEEQRIQTSG